METGNIIEKLAICSGDKSIALMRNESYAFALHPQNKPFVCEKDPPWSFYKNRKTFCNPPIKRNVDFLQALTQNEMRFFI